MKLQKIGDIQPSLPFTEYDFLKKYRESFAVSELGRIHAMLPLKEMAEELASHFPKKHPGETGACWDSMGVIKQCQDMHFRAGRQD